MNNKLIISSLFILVATQSSLLASENPKKTYDSLAPMREFAARQERQRQHRDSQLTPAQPAVTTNAAQDDSDRSFEVAIAAVGAIAALSGAAYAWWNGDSAKEDAAKK